MQNSTSICQNQRKLVSQIFVFDQKTSSILHALHVPFTCMVHALQVPFICKILLNFTLRYCDTKAFFSWERKMLEWGILLIQLSLQGIQIVYSTCISCSTCQTVTFVTHKVPIFNLWFKAKAQPSSESCTMTSVYGSLVFHIGEELFLQNRCETDIIIEHFNLNLYSTCQ